MDDCDWLLSVEKACDWLRIEPGVTGNFLLKHPVLRFFPESFPEVFTEPLAQCGNRQCGEDRRLRNPYQVDTDPCTDLVNREYMFYLALENDICTDYITEKAFNALKLNTIPILLTGAQINSSLPPNSVIDGLRFQPEELADYLYSLLRQPQAVWSTPGRRSLKVLLKASKAILPGPGNGGISSYKAQ